jgi:hypothetical protein
MARAEVQMTCVMQRAILRLNGNSSIESAGGGKPPLRFGMDLKRKARATSAASGRQRVLDLKTLPHQIIDKVDF